jgi:hypothetical protein
MVEPGISRRVHSKDQQQTLIQDASYPCTVVPLRDLLLLPEASVVSTIHHPVSDSGCCPYLSAPVRRERLYLLHRELTRLMLIPRSGSFIGTAAKIVTRTASAWKLRSQCHISMWFGRLPADSLLVSVIFFAVTAALALPLAGHPGSQAECAVERPADPVSRAWVC